MILVITKLMALQMDGKTSWGQSELTQFIGHIGNTFPPVTDYNALRYMTRYVILLS